MSKKTKITVAITPGLFATLTKKCAAQNISKSDAVEQAIKHWLRHELELDEEEYFATAAQELNEDAKEWLSLTSRNFTS